MHQLYKQLILFLSGIIGKTPQYYDQDLSRIILPFQYSSIRLQHIIKNNKPNMNRRFLRHFFDMHDPFFFPSGFHRPVGIQFRPLTQIQRLAIMPRNQPQDPHQIFDRFFDENGISEKEKDFFKKNFPQKVQEESNPYKVLEISKDATEEQIKEAYRKLAIKYHPKNNTSPEAQSKFSELGKAYQEAIQANNHTRQSNLGFKSFFQDFDESFQQVFEKELKNSKQIQSEKDSKKKDSYGQVFSQSSHVQNINGKQMKYVCQKKYVKDGQFMSVKREQKLKQDGKTQIIETIDDGKQVKKKHYILDKNSKEAKQIDQKSQTKKQSKIQAKQQPKSEKKNESKSQSKEQTKK